MIFLSLAWAAGIEVLGESAAVGEELSSAQIRDADDQPAR
jgi:hypothetical protein